MLIDVVMHMQPEGCVPTMEQAPLSLTSLDIAPQLLKKPPDATSPADLQTTHMVPLEDVLQGICSLRRLSCPVRTTDPLMLQHLTACPSSYYVAMSPKLAHDDPAACS